MYEDRGDEARVRLNRPCRLIPRRKGKGAKIVMFRDIGQGGFCSTCPRCGCKILVPLSECPNCNAQKREGNDEIFTNS